MAACGGCGADIMWASLPSGARIPLDVEMVPKEQARPSLVAFRAEDGAGMVLKQEHIGEKWLTSRKITLFESHYATCPKGAQYRGTGQQQLGIGG